jgi:hypothetical protein
LKFEDFVYKGERMPIKPVSGPRCIKHQIECMYNCGWCSRPICDECVALANGKKYCDKCWAKKQQMTPQMIDTPARPSGPRTPIRNVDTTLDPKVAEQKRVINEQPKKKIFDL